jgi:hypothetical protein
MLGIGGDLPNTMLGIGGDLPNTMLGIGGTCRTQPQVPSTSSGQALRLRAARSTQDDGKNLQSQKSDCKTTTAKQLRQNSYGKTATAKQQKRVLRPSTDCVRSGLRMTHVDVD